MGGVVELSQRTGLGPSGPKTLKAFIDPLRPVVGEVTAGDELRCPHCRTWHPVRALHTMGTDYTVRMLYWEYRGQDYYARNIGPTRRHNTRKPPQPHATLRRR